MKFVLSDTSKGTIGSYRKRIETSEVLIDSDSNWLITLSDVMTLLLIFFVMFFVATYHTADEIKREKPAYANESFPPQRLSPEMGVARDDVQKKMVSLIQDANMGNDVTIQAIEEGIIITMKEKITFMPGDVQILKGSEEILDGIANILQQNASYMIEINGHTDNIPISTPGYPSNWELSVARATSVLKYFINKHGINPSRFSIKGDAEQRPIVANDTPEHRAQNRRVEIRLKEAGNSL